MVVYLLNFQATLENVSEVHFFVDALEWCLDVSESAGEGVRQRVTFSRHDTVELVNSRGVANFAVKWEGSMKQSYLNVVDVKNVTRASYCADDSEKWVAILALDCRGLQPTACHSPSFGIAVTSTSGKRFQDVDFSENEWCDYDETSAQSVGVYDVKWNFTVHKK